MVDKMEQHTIMFLHKTWGIYYPTFHNNGQTLKRREIAVPDSSINEYMKLELREIALIRYNLPILQAITKAMLSKR